MTNKKEAFDYSQVDELTAKRLKKSETEIKGHMKKLGEAAWEIGILKLGNKASLKSRIEAASRVLEIESEMIEPAIRFYLEGDNYE